MVHRPVPSRVAALRRADRVAAVSVDGQAETGAEVEAVAVVPLRAARLAVGRATTAAAGFSEIWTMR